VAFVEVIWYVQQVVVELGDIFAFQSGGKRLRIAKDIRLSW